MKKAPGLIYNKNEIKQEEKQYDYFTASEGKA